MKFDKICMNDGKKFSKLKLRVLETDVKIYRDFCCIECLVEYYCKVLNQSEESQ